MVKEETATLPIRTIRPVKHSTFACTLQWEDGLTVHATVCWPHGVELRYKANGSERSALVTVAAYKMGAQYRHHGFRCPRCNRFAKQIHLPPGKTRFACCECYDLVRQATRKRWFLIGLK